MTTLDQFLSPSESKPRLPEERCANPKCRKILKITDIKYTLRVKGKEGVYCRTCAKEILRPLEDSEGNL